MRKRMFDWGARGVLLGALLLAVPQAMAQERYSPEGRDRWKSPLTWEEMGDYEKIPFDSLNYEKVNRGMTEEEVLKLLGRPVNVDMQKRRGDRWTVKYVYPGGKEVNFKNGLVVGKTE